MRNNQPVTNVEYVLSEDDMIVSKTDLKGKITYINEDFIRVSGFAESELIGQNHNIVRHPDMPEEAFADLWSALKAKRPWSGLVKNRCKNGDYYWVVANVTPIYEHGQCIGYMSVRGKPTSEQVGAASAAYAKFKSGQAKGLAIKDGSVVKTGVAANLNIFKNTAAQNVLGIMLGLMAVLLCVIAYVGLSGVNSAETVLQAIKPSQTPEVAQQISIVQQEYVTARTQIALLVILGFLILLGTFLTMGRRVFKPVENIVSILLSIAQGKYDNSIELKRQDEIAKVLEALQSMQIRLGFEVAEALRVSNENLRIKIGLDNVSTCVMISDNERKIIYMNKAVQELMHNVEKDLQKAIPNFSADQLMGSTIDNFHKNPEHQKSMLANLNSTYKTEIEVGGRVFALAANPVINERGTRLGAALEWLDRTEEVAVEKEVAAIVNDAVSGNFTSRVSLEDKKGFFKILGEGINRLMETSDRGLQEIASMLAALSEGDLTQRIDSEYKGTFEQLRNDANRTAVQLTEIVNQIKSATDTINTAAKEISSGNTDLSQRTEEQASSLEETASSMEELTSTVKQNAENAKQANQLAKGASDIAGKGGEVVGQVVSTMDSINESSRKVSDIITVIDGIAFQTNILALNAAVEAARAGEQGRGFAVVAGEVRNLAQRSASAAKEIKALIGESVDKVEGGSKLVSQAGNTMEEIVTAIKRVTDIMSEIAAASVEQSSGIEQVNQAITQMDEVTQQNAALVEEAAAAAESLEEEASTLSTSVSVFKVSDQAQFAPAPAVQKAVTSDKKSSSPAKPEKARKPAKPGKAVEDDEWEEF